MIDFLNNETKINQILQHTSIDAFVYLYAKSIGKEYDFDNKADIEMALIVSGYLNASLLPTDKGKKFLSDILGKQQASSKMDINYVELHKKLQAELKRLTNKNQKMLQGKYAFLCNALDLQSRLSRIVKKYKIEDYNKLEKLLIAYIYRCYKADFNYCQTICYYIEKNGASNLANDYMGFEEMKEEKKEVLTDTKELF